MLNEGAFMKLKINKKMKFNMKFKDLKDVKNNMKFINFKSLPIKKKLLLSYMSMAILTVLCGALGLVFFTKN